MLLKNISAMALCSLLLSASTWAEEPKLPSQGQPPQTASTKMPEAAKQRLAQRVQAKQQQAKPEQEDNKQKLAQRVQAKQQQAKPEQEDNKQKLAQKVQAKQEQAKPKQEAVKLKQEAVKPQPKRYLSMRRVNLDGSPYVEPEQPAKKHKKKKNVEAKPYEERAFYMDTMLPRDYQNISIFGEAKATKAQAVAYLRNNNPTVKLSCSPEKLVDLYWEEALREGICPDLTFCQAIVETGFFRYGGDVVYKQNNFCGLGTTGGGVRGASFKTPQLGVRAHVQHLLAYSKTAKPKTPIVDPRYRVAHDLRLSRGMVDKWSGLNGTWAMGAEYCEKIMYHHVRMQAAKPLSVGNLQPTFKRNRNTQNQTMRERLAKNRSLRK